MKFLLLGIALSFPLLAQTQSWTGLLIDFDCYSSSSSTRCSADSHTTNLGLLTPAGQAFRIDPSTIARVQALFQGQTGDVTATLMGELEGNTIRVESVSTTGMDSAIAPPPPPSNPPPPPCALPLADGGCYSLRVPANLRAHRPNRKRKPSHIVITGTLEGDTIRVDSVTLH